MSSGSDDDDLGGLSATTPKPPRRAVHSRRKQEDAAPIIVDASPSPPQPSKSRTVPIASRNGPKGKSAKAQGKAKAEPLKPRTRRGPDEGGEAREGQSDDQMEVEEIVQQSSRTGPQNKPKHIIAGSKSPTNELDKLRQKNVEAKAQIAALSAQLEEYMQVRMTGPEDELKKQRERYKSHIQVQDALIKDLTSQLARKEPLMRAGDTSVLPFITRDAADEEKQMLSDELAASKAAIKEKEALIDQQTKRILELEKIVATEGELQQELKMEIERGKSLASKSSRVPPGSTTRGRPGQSVLGPDDPKHVQVIKFYEDLTNLLVPSMKVQPGKYLGIDDWSLTCIFTFVDEESEKVYKKSLTFTLRFYHDVAPDEEEPITSKDQLLATVEFTPLELDKEAPDFVSRLGYLGQVFAFPQFQLSLLFQTLQRHMSDASAPEREHVDKQIPDTEAASV
ncbi:hypothetical protein BD779DRAFT_1670860 [Infundibulicybe gibba]|nr:hypothetical protein BD779DRAFT_1670860 [Infundibulicybe gibba]